MMPNTETDTKSFFAKKEFKKVIFLNVGTLLLLVVGIVLLTQIQSTAHEIKTIKEESTTSLQQSDVAFIETELATYEQQIADIEGMIPSETQLVAFVSEVGRLQSEGLVQSFNLLSQQVTTDRTGNTGFPFRMVFSGTQEQVDAALRTIQNLPFVIRGLQTTVKYETNEAGETVMVLDYGGFIYAIKN